MVIEMYVDGCGRLPGEGHVYMTQVFDWRSWVAVPPQAIIHYRGKSDNAARVALI